MKAMVLAGGSGTRLWPLSREDYPKQFLKIDNNQSLLRQTVQRLLNFLSPSEIIILTNDKYRFHVKDDLEGLPEEVLTNIVLEPFSRNTAPAIALSIKYCKEIMGCDTKEVLLVCPSDHVIRPDDRFAAYARRASEIAAENYIVTFGVRPTRPETGYGYIKVKGERLGKGGKADYFIVESFTEKPDERTARKYLSDSKYFWNSGIFVFSVGTMEREIKRHIPEISELSNDKYEKMLANFQQMPNISIDYAVLEHSNRVTTIPVDLYWNDIGSWDSLYEILERDENGNVKVGDVFDLKTKDTIIIGSKRIISTIGLKDILIIETPDAMLVARRGDAQMVKEVVKELRDRGRRESVESSTVYRPWGSYTILEEGTRYKIKRIVVKPGAKLSLQMHHHRSEHWVVIKGTSRVTIGDEVKFIHENESIYIPKSTLHRLENPGKVALEIIEVQNGEYVAEDDIVRIDDVYGR
ncbi:MAG: mannose-1-phosphate guanylyltransferase/mannose-6-phosphate isomerase [Nitrospirota bacterium]